MYAYRNFTGVYSLMYCEIVEPDEPVGDVQHNKALAEQSINELLFGKSVLIEDKGKINPLLFFCEVSIPETHFIARSCGPNRLDARINATECLLTQLEAWRLVHNLPMPSANAWYGMGGI